MSPFPRSFLARVTVALLLSWTAVDLIDENLCALDSVPFPVATDSRGITTAPGHNEAPASPFQHVDDCFCCSHCVAAGQPVEALMCNIVSDTPEAAVPASPDRPALQFYHPPRA